MLQKVNVAIVDTSVLCSHKELSKCNIKIMQIDDSISFNEKGHGTAVAAILHNVCPDANIDVYPIFENTTSTIDPQVLIDTLNIIANNGKYHLINLSMGIVSSSFDSQLREVCNRLTEQGSIIVSAFDNAGRISYPACYSNVIGVDISENNLKSNEYEYVENSIVNIRCSSKIKRLAWDNPSVIFAAGTSFVVPFISGLISCGLLSGLTIHDINELLKKNACKVYKFNEQNVIPVQNNLLESAIVLPFNKEIHTLIRYNDQLSFKINAVYDIKYRMNVGRKTSAIIKQELDNDYVIKSIEEIDWDSDSFNMVIIGHLQEIINVVGYHFLDEIMKNIAKFKKIVYTFDIMIKERYAHLSNTTIITPPQIDNSYVPVNNLGHMWQSTTPIFGVFGTRSRQGKVTVQILIKQKLEKLGYKVGYLSTEPNGALLGADNVFNFGYYGSVTTEVVKYPVILNEMMHQIELKNPDIIMVGSQSGTIPYAFTHMKYNFLSQAAFLQGTLPDCVFLCINPDDEIDYINRTIAYIESYVDTKVIGLFLFPILETVSVLSGTQRIYLDESQLAIDIARIASETGRHVEPMSYTGIEKHINRLLSFFE